MNVTLLKKMTRVQPLSSHMRAFSVAYNVKSKFEAAYNTKMEGLNKVAKKT